MPDCLLSIIIGELEEYYQLSEQLKKQPAKNNVIIVNELEDI